MSRRVVVTGIGLVSSLGIGTETNWDALCKGCSGVGPITKFDTTDFSARIAGEVKNFDPLRFIEKKDVKKMDIFIQYAIAASQFAMDDSKLQITAENAPNLKCHLIVEGANGPCTAEADAIINKKGIMVVPDILANAGGVTVSYFEWLKNLSRVRMGRIARRFDASSKEGFMQQLELVMQKPMPHDLRESLTRGADEVDLVYSGLEDSMCSAFEQTFNTSANKKTNMRTAALALAIEKVAQDYLALGIFP